MLEKLYPEKPLASSAVAPMYVTFPPALSVLRFLPTVAQSMWWPVIADDYAGGALTFEVNWFAEIGTVGAVTWGASIVAVTPGDAGALQAQTPGAETVVTTTHLGTTPDRPHRTTIVLSDNDGLADGDMAWLRLRRRGDTPATDTLAGYVDFVAGLIHD